MITINQSFPTAAAAEAFASSYLADWPPCGYGTQLSTVATPDGTFIVTGSRLASCD